MAVGVSMPQRKDNNAGLSKLLTIGGAVAGGMAGGPAGAMQGASMGQMAGGLMAKQEAGPQAVESNALSRRMQQIDQSPLRQIRESIDSLKYVQDDQMRAELAKPLLQADYMARMKG